MELALLDTNVLVHAAYRGGAHHAAAATLLNIALTQSRRFCIAPQNLIEFAAVVTRARFVEPPLPAGEVARMSNLLYRSRRLTKIYPQRGTVIRAIREGSNLVITGPSWYDLFLAMTMKDARVEVVITDNVSDFQKFPFITARSIDHAV
jgi:predicted nucleic acid-binding protein